MVKKKKKKMSVSRQKRKQRRVRKIKVGRKASRIYKAFPVETDKSELVDLPPHSSLRGLELKFEIALSRPKVSIVIVNHDGVDLLWHCLFALKTQNYPIHEIILVDNASEDASISFVKANYPQVKILECQDDFGPVLGGNLGSKCATGDLVILLNIGTVVAPDWLSKTVKEFKENWPQAGVLATLSRTQPGVGDEKAKHYQTINIIGKPVEGFFQNSREVFYPKGNSLVFARHLSPEGPFDPDYYSYQEDVYLGWKLRQMGIASRRTLSAKIYSGDVTLLSDLPDWKWHYFQNRNRWLNLFLFYETKNLLKILPWLFIDALGQWVSSLFVGLDPFLGISGAVAWFFMHPVVIYKKRRIVQSKRKLSDQEILRCISGRIAEDHGILSRVLNFLSLGYCAVVNLDILESQESP